MNLIKPSVEILTISENPLQLIEKAGRTCYKSNDKITDKSAPNFIRTIMKRGHESVIEHSSATVRFICDRGVSHEIVRHRLASYSQESTRYVRSSDKPLSFNTDKDIIIAYEHGLSMRRIAELSNKTEWQVYKILDSNDIPRRGLNNKGIIHEDFFDEINTHEKAYLLGLIQADGNVRTKNWQLSITQHTDNAWYIERMLKNYIRNYICNSPDKNCRDLSFCSQHLIESLINHGIIPNKSFVGGKVEADRLRNSISNVYWPAFIRGLMDGDGSIRFFKQKNPGETDSGQLIWNGEKSLLEHINTWLETEIGYQATVRPCSDTKKLYKLVVSQPEICEEICRRMFVGFQFPYGNPVKTGRILKRIGGIYPTAIWGSSEFQVIIPCWLKNPGLDVVGYYAWLQSMDTSEEIYTNLIEIGWRPEQARSVLPNSLKTELVMTANFREWHHFFKLRTSPAAHPQMREVAVPLLKAMSCQIPVLFDDLVEKVLLSEIEKYPA